VSANPLESVVTYPEPRYPRPVLAVLIPCYNEEATIAKVVTDFRAALPDATVFVYDNGSTDQTIAQARQAGAVVRTEPRRGKGNVVRRMFADIEADVFVLVDGDDTYEAAAAPRLVDRLIAESLDMVNAARVSISGKAYRPGHEFGNAVLTGFVARIFGSHVSDMLSGYRVFSRRFVKSFPTQAAGFEIETEFTIHALELRLPMAEVALSYKERPEGSASKLQTYRDGIRILRFIFRLIKQERPLQFFGYIFVLLTLVSVGLEVPVILTYMQTGLVPRLPTALLGTGIGILAFLSLTCGLILDTVTQGRTEAKRMHYLRVPIRFDVVGYANAGARPTLKIAD
jgi:glycosyltransferase involved in cell wall biosynthesis